jgi:outer membrane protein OmpA-like peptidoglycan-associated protein
MMGLRCTIRTARSAFSALMLTAGVIACLGAGAACAQDAETIVKALQPKANPSPPAARKPLVRSFIQPNRGIAIEGPEPQEGPAPSIDLVVNFEYDQSALTMSDAQITVDTLGRALNDARLAKSRFMIIGHTDARGGDAYNLPLSQRRAEAVRSRLVQFHKVDPSRLVAEGHGQSELKEPSRPEDAINRRVQIKTITSDPRETPAEPVKPHIVMNEQPAPRFTSPPAQPPQTVIDQPPATNFQPLPQRPRSRFYELPVRPDPVSTPSSLLPMQRIAAFSGSSANAAPVLVAALMQRVGADAAPTDAEIGRMASAALDNSEELVAILKTTPASLREDRVQALLIAEVVHKLDGPPRIDLQASTKEALEASLQDLFSEAARDVYTQTRVIIEAQKLTRNSNALLDAVNDLVAKGLALPGLETIATDRGKVLIAAIEQNLQEMAETEMSKPLDEIFERRNTLVQCVVLRLSAIAEANARREPGQRAPSSKVRLTESTQIGTISDAVFMTNIRANCLPMLSSTDRSMPVQAGPGDLDRTLRAPINFAPKP